MPWVQDAKVDKNICKAAFVSVDGEHDRRLSGALNMAGSTQWAKGEGGETGALQRLLGAHAAPLTRQKSACTCIPFEMQ